MLDTFACPVCGSRGWSPVETFVYSRTDRQGGTTLPLSRVWHGLKTAGRVLLIARPSRRPVARRSLTAYQLLRRGVLFDVWLPTRDTVTLTSSYCTACGFMAYSPRPSEEDVAAKYAYLKQVEPDIGGQEGYDPRALRADSLRADRIFDRCMARLGPGTKAEVRGSTGRIRVLDYGGGNGKLLKPYVAAGHSCYLVDYNDNPAPGVTKICDDMRGFPGEDTFDLIICSHVLEHVSDLSGLVLFLRRHLEPESLLYAEVPQEIWAGLRLEADPVTHINFFTQNSLASLFLLNGFDIVQTQQQIASYGKTPLEVIWILARVTSSGRRDCLPPDVKSLLYPSRRASLRRMYEMSIEPRLGGLCRSARSHLPRGVTVRHS
jgi:SAM-dependent methyltransferase